jgi:hypothetical protein
MQFTRKLEVVATPDVLVCGAGCAGTTAALAAARRGASVMLIERFGFAGGYITGVIGASFDGFVDLRSGYPVVGGIVAEFAQQNSDGRQDVMTASYSPSNELREMRETPNRRPIRFNIEGFKRSADQMFRKAGARVLYYTSVVDVLREGDRIAGVVVGNKAGLSIIRPKQVVDATGDADVAAWAGAPFDMNDEMQPMSLHFRMVNVKIGPTTRDECAAAVKAAQARGELGLYGGPWIGRLESDTEVYVNACRSPGNGTNPVDLTNAEIKGREDAYTMFKAFKTVKGFEDAYFSSTGPFVGVRETRRIVGDKTLTIDDIASERPQPDVIALGAWWLDRHPQGQSGYHMHEMVRPYDIAYGTLLPQGIGNLWVAGRCHAADSAALASSRVTVTAMGLGEAAGAAAALANANKTDSRGLKIRTLQDDLLRTGSIILDRADKIRAAGDAMTEIPVSAVR